MLAILLSVIGGPIAAAAHAAMHGQHAAPVSQTHSDVHCPQHTHEEHGADTYWFGHPGDPAKVTRTIKVTAMDIKFEPTELTVKAGETIRFEVTNTGKLEHEKEMQEMMQKMPGMSMDHNDPNSLTVQAGESKTLVWSFTKAGKLQYGCHVPGHFPAGMVGQWTIQ